MKKGEHTSYTHLRTQGKSKYCQSCSKETEELFEVPFDKYNTIKVCADCRDKT